MLRTAQKEGSFVVEEVSLCGEGHLQFLHQELSALIYERKDRDVMRI
jgi:hypothetical protein